MRQSEFDADDRINKIPVYNEHDPFRLWLLRPPGGGFVEAETPADVDEDLQAGMVPVGAIMSEPGGDHEKEAGSRVRIRVIFWR